MKNIIKVSILCALLEYSFVNVSQNEMCIVMLPACVLTYYYTTIT